MADPAGLNSLRDFAMDAVSPGKRTTAPNEDCSVDCGPILGAPNAGRKSPSLSRESSAAQCG